MPTTDTTDALRAIRALHCDADAVATLLSAIETQYGQWLQDQDLIGLDDTGYGTLLDAESQISDLAVWYSGAVRAASRQPLSSIERAVLGERA
jgi:hypothetical protein